VVNSQLLPRIQCTATSAPNQLPRHHLMFP
jgi:hypothetical protein